MGAEDDDDDKGGGGGGGSGELGQVRAQLADARRKLRAANERITELQGQITDLEPKAQSSETLTRRIQELERERDGERSGRSFDRAVAAKGITDPEGVDLVQLQYQRLPEQNRPKPEDWLNTLTADPAKAPKWLSPYLPQQGQGQQAQGGAAGGAAGAGAGGQQQRPNPNGGAVGGAPAGGGGTPSQAEINAARAAALRGDRGAWDAMQARLGFGGLPKLDGA
jgi:TolA-binding protein